MTINVLKYQQMIQQQYLGGIGQAGAGLGIGTIPGTATWPYSSQPGTLVDQPPDVEPNNKLLLLEDEEL